MSVTTIMRVSAALGMEWGVVHVGIAAQSLQQLQDDVIVANPDRVAQNLCWQVTIAEMPGDTHEMGGVAGANIDNTLWSGLHEHCAAVAQGQAVAIR